MKELKRLFRVWLRLTSSSMQASFASRIGGLMFITAKLLRFGSLYLIIIFFIQKVNSVSGYTQDQILLIFLTFTLIDTLSQLFFREVYRFRPKIVSGDFDLDLVKPLPSLFRPLLGGADPFDLVVLVPFVAVFFSVAGQFTPTLGEIVLFGVLLCSALLVSASFHIFVLSLGVVTTQIDHAILIYRDTFNMGRFPLDIYNSSIRLILTYVVPISFMIMLPARVLSSSFEVGEILIAICLSLVLFFLSLGAWKLALRQYTSASS